MSDYLSREMADQWTRIILLLGAFTTVLCSQSTELCVTTAQPTDIELKCDVNQKIHVISIRYQQALPDCRVIQQGCEDTASSLETGLFTNCNGHQSCNHTVTNYQLGEKCPRLQAMIATVSYDCVTGGEDICMPVNKSVNNLFYLITPNFPHLSYPGVCNCTVRGPQMKVEILTLVFAGPPEARASLNLTGDNTTMPFRSWAFNHPVFESVTSFKLDFDGRNLPNQNLWIKILGNTGFNLVCNEHALTTTVPTTTTTTMASTVNRTTGNSTTTPVVSTATNASGLYSKTEDPKPNMIPIAVGSVLGALVVIVVILVVIFVVYRRKRPKYLSSSGNHLHDNHPAA